MESRLRSLKPEGVKEERAAVTLKAYAFVANVHWLFFRVRSLDIAIIE